MDVSQDFTDSPRMFKTCLIGARSGHLAGYGSATLS